MTTQHVSARLIVGLGLSGLATARFCLRQGWAFDLCDSRSSLANAEDICQSFPQSRVTLGPLDGDVLCQYQQLIVSPGVALSEPALQQARDAGVEIIGDIELFARFNETPVIAITGSNGKSTVTTLVRDILCRSGLRAVMAGNIGVPVLDIVDSDAVTADVVVLELSSFQLETTFSLKARAATILNLSEDHMDRYDSLADYAAAKQRIYRGAESIVLNRDDPATLPAEGLANITGFTQAEPVEDDFGLVAGELDGVDGQWIVRSGLRLFHSSQMSLKGRHNLANIMAALALVESAGINAREAGETLQEFPGLPHRCERVAEVSGVTYINDSKGTNVGSTLAAIAGFAGLYSRIWLLVGGVAKDQDFAPLVEACIGPVAGVFCFGRDASVLTEAFAAADGAIEIDSFDDLDQAFAAATGLALPGDLVLLSPACASLDQFVNYMARGEHFGQLVGRLSCP